VLNQQIHFMKNLAILGGLFGVIAHGAGRLALDRASAADVEPARARQVLA